jgi:hypothetical protein
MVYARCTCSYIPAGAEDLLLAGLVSKHNGKAGIRLHGTITTVVDAVLGSSFEYVYHVCRCTRVSRTVSVYMSLTDKCVYDAQGSTRMYITQTKYSRAALFLCHLI